MKNLDLKDLLEYLQDKYDQWYVARKLDKERIEDLVYQFIDKNLDDTLYIEVNDGRAAGLCAFPHFEEDLKKIISIIENKLIQIKQE